MIDIHHPVFCWLVNGGIMAMPPFALLAEVLLAGDAVTIGIEGEVTGGEAGLCFGAGGELHAGEGE